MAIAKSSNSSTETASVASESASTTDVSQKKKKRKKSPRQSDDGQNTDTVGDECSAAELELKQTQQWLLSQMRTGLSSSAASSSRFLFVVFCHFLWFSVHVGYLLTCHI